MILPQLILTPKYTCMPINKTCTCTPAVSSENRIHSVLHVTLCL